MKFFAGAAVALLIVLGVLILAGAPDQQTGDQRPNTVVEAEAPVDIRSKSSAPLRRHQSTQPAFTIDAPEDWRVMTKAELAKAAEDSGDDTEISDIIIGLTSAAAGRDDGDMIMFSRAEQDGTPLEALEIFASAFSFAATLNFSGGGMEITTTPYKHEVQNLPAASLAMAFESSSGAKSELRISAIDFPNERVLITMAADDPFRKAEAEAIIASFKVRG